MLTNTRGMKKHELREIMVLKHLVEEYIQTSEPVASKTICEKYLPDVSSATIRLDLHKLESKRYISQPHTSAGREPTLSGYRNYIKLIKSELLKEKYDNEELLRHILVKHYDDTFSAFQMIMRLLAKETDQLSFVAEPEIAYGYLSNLEVFKISDKKLLFVVSLDSKVDKTVIINCGFDMTEQQLKALVRYVNENLKGMRIHEIQNKYLDELAEKEGEVNLIFLRFLQEFRKALVEMSSYYIHFEAGVKFLEQPEFDSKGEVLNFLSLTQRQDVLLKTMQNSITDEPYKVLFGEDWGFTEWSNYSLAYSKYELFGIPGYLGVLAPVRMDYKKNVPIIKNMAQIITDVTKKGAIISKSKGHRREI